MKRPYDTNAVLVSGRWYRDGNANEWFLTEVG